MFKVVVSESDDIDTEDAVAELIESSDEQLEGLNPQAGIVFCGTEYEHDEVLELLSARFPDIQIIGCTTDGEMSDEGGFTEDAITLTLFCSDTISIAAGIGKGAGANPRQAAKEAVDMAKSNLDGEPKLAIVLPDGLTSSAYLVLDGFNKALGVDVPVVGGMSADRVAGSKTEYSTFQFHADKVYSDAVPVLLFSGPLLFSLGVESGWSPIGQKMTVTRSEDNILYELDGKPAYELYTHYLGEAMKESISGLGSYPLAVYEPDMEKFYLRVAKSADPDTGKVTFLGEIPQGSEVQITQAIRDQVINGVDQSVSKALESYPGKTPGAAMMFSCTGRKIALGTKTREEVEHVKEILPDSIPMSGFYTFGEIGPVSDHSRARYHNTTFITLLMGES